MRAADVERGRRDETDVVYTVRRPHEARRLEQRVDGRGVRPRRVRQVQNDVVPARLVGEPGAHETHEALAVAEEQKALD